MSNLQIKKVFIANRGEVVRRIAHSAKSLGIQTACVASGTPPVYLSGVIDHFLFVSEENVALYLNQEKMIALALEASCDAVHPGFGFLSENHSFAQKVQEAGLNWVGPDPLTIKKMADKSEARKIAEALKVPCTKALGNYSHKSKKDLERLKKFSEVASFPLLVKAALGGGGKGMRLVHKAEDLDENIEKASREAKSSFGDETLIIEEYIEKSRHVEVQIVGDKSGQIKVLGDRDCSIQRRHQKILEEAPAPFLKEETRKELHNCARRLAEEIGYVSCGTVEFLLSWDAKKGHKNLSKIYFLEMNTRLQVEHPVTEEVFGVDLVALQFKVAQGISFSKEFMVKSSRGHSIEARIYLEDPKRNFLPIPGYVPSFIPYEQRGIRWEIGLDKVGEVSGQFDPMVAKVIATAETREGALSLLRESLSQTFLATTASNIALLCEILDEPLFVTNSVSTDYLQHNLPSLISKIEAKELAFQPSLKTIIEKCKIMGEADKGQSSYSQKSDFKSLTEAAYLKKGARKVKEKDEKKEEVKLQKKEILIDLNKAKYPIYYSCFLFESNDFRVKTIHCSFFQEEDNEKKLFVGYNGLVFIKEWKKKIWLGKKGEEGSSLGMIAAEVPGKIIKVLIKNKDQVKKNQSCFVLESMKMEFDIKSMSPGVVSNVLVAEGDQVNSGKVLAKLDA